jgi:hypothetical protein
MIAGLPPCHPRLPRRNHKRASGGNAGAEPLLTHPAPATHEITAEDRMERLGELTTAQLTDAMLWLSGYAPPIFDAVIAAVEPGPGDDGSNDPAPFCERCGADIGIFCGSVC